jgi:hypothetical protein
MLKQLSKADFFEIDTIIGFDGRRPNRTVEDKYRKILDILQYYKLNENY